MSFWNINIDDWIRGRLYLDENISAYMFHTTAWYGNNNSSYNRYSEFNDIIESYDADLREKDLLEEFRDIIPLHHRIQEWPQELMIEEYQTISGEQTHLEPFSPYHYYINATPKVSEKEKRKRKRKFKKSLKSHLNSYANDDVITYAHHDPDVLYSEDKEVAKEKDYPIEITRSNDRIRITTQIPFVDDKNNIKVKIYDDNSIEISIDDAHLLQSNNKYHLIVEVPKDADIETARCTYRNGVMEITFKQKNTVLD